MDLQSDTSGQIAPFSSCLQSLERHAQRRRQGIPTLSVLVGPVEACAAAWLEWTAATQRRGSMEEWPARRSFSNEDLREARPETATAAAQGQPPQRPEEQDLVPVKLFVPPRGIDGVARGAPSMGARASVRLLQAAIEALAAQLESPGDRQTSRAFSLAVSAEIAGSFLREAPECRAKALFREGWIDIPAPGAKSHPAAGTDLPFHPTQNNGSSLQAAALTALTLTHQGASAATIGCFQEATLAWEETLATSSAPRKITDSTLDRARSAAERFLFKLLDELPETKGCFALNAALGFCFGPKPAEVDLLSSGLRIAVEIDGYRHFQDAAAYRRDRRKDALLQTQGYLVLRFLAEDVVTRLEEILDQVREAVAFRRVTVAQRTEKL